MQEHFATAFLRRRLTALFHAYPQPLDRPARDHRFRRRPSGTTSASCWCRWRSRRHGWRVIYLGQNVAAEHLLREVRKLKPDMVCLSAATRESAGELAEVYRAVDELPEPKPHLVFGGGAFNAHPELAAPVSVGAEIVASAATSSCSQALPLTRSAPRLAAARTPRFTLNRGARSYLTCSDNLPTYSH